MTLPHIAITIDELTPLLDHLHEAAAYFDQQFGLAYENMHYRLLPENLRQFVQEQVSVQTRSQAFFEAATEHYYDVQKIALAGGQLVIATHLRIKLAGPEAALSVMIEQMRQGKNIFTATATSLARCLGWRWVAVTQFIDAERIKVLGWWDVDRIGDNFEYALAGVPCAVVARSGKYVLFTDVDELFSDDKDLREMGAKVYAGLIYYGVDNQPLGHVFAMHDSLAVDYEFAENALHLATVTLSTCLLLEGAKAALTSAETAAKSEPMTGLGNRAALSEMLMRINADYRRRADTDAIAAVIDLDGLKYLNDNFGHKEGDCFIQVFAQELKALCREQDAAFRVGGDEFILLFPNARANLVGQLKHRFDHAIERVRLALNREVGASIGMAALSETAGDTEQWLALADQRMYDYKQKQPQRYPR